MPAARASRKLPGEELTRNVAVTVYRGILQQARLVTSFRLQRTRPSLTGRF